MIKKIENLDIEKKVRVYRKCIETIVSRYYVKGESKVIEGILFSFSDLLDICYYAVPIYGSKLEKNKFYSTYGSSLVSLDEKIIENISLERMKYIYDYRDANCKDRDKIKKLAKRLNINILDIPRLAKDYAVSYLKYNSKDYDWHIFCKKRGNIKAKMSYGMLFDLLLSFDDIDDIAYMIDYSGVDIYNYNEKKINNYVYVNHSDKSINEQKKIFKNIKEKVDLYIKIKRLKEEEDKDSERRILMEEARNFLNSFVHNTKTYKYKAEFCRAVGVSRDSFSYYMNIIKKSSLEEDKNLYKLCLKKIKEGREVGSSDINNLALIISNYVLNGIPTDNGIRDFDLIDFYSLTNLSSKEIGMACEKILEKPDYVKIKKFLAASDNLRKTLMNSKKAIDLDIEFNCKKDSDGFPIVGTGRKLTEEERCEILDLFDRYNIPLYLFKVAVDRIKRGISVNDLVINTRKVKKKIKIHE